MQPEELLKPVIEVAQKLNYQIRYEWLGGEGTRTLRYRDETWLFVDQSDNEAEQCTLITSALATDSRIAQLELSSPVREWFQQVQDQQP